jgi:chondroitin AC lyase
METSRNNRNIEILANTSDVQAVKNNKLGISQVAFYKAGEVKMADGLKVRMDSQGMAMLKVRGDKVQELTVSDPSRKLSKVMVTLSGRYDAKGDYFRTFSQSDLKSTAILVDLPQGVYAGKSVTIKFNMLP